MFTTNLDKHVNDIVLVTNTLYQLQVDKLEKEIEILRQNGKVL